MRVMAMIWFSVVFLAACQSAPETEAGMIVSLIADGVERTYSITEPMTVEDFLTTQVVSLDDNDRLTPPLFTQISDGLRVTIVRVDEQIECERIPVPYEEERVFSEALAPGEERISRVGQNGEQEICYRVIFENGEERQRIPNNQPQIINAPINEVLIVGVDQEVEPIPIGGTLAYINNGNAWAMSGSSTSKRILTESSRLDSHVLSLSPDGRYLIYTREPEDPDGFVNELWLIDTTGSADPVQLGPTDVLYAEWLPTEDYTISYSSGEVQEIAPFWDALNNLWTTRIDPQTGRSLNIRQIVPESTGGLSGWWGTVFKWSPDGSQLAWVRADSAGVVDAEGGLVTLITYPHFRVGAAQNWSWRADISWLWDNSTFVTTLHGPPLGDEPPERSPVFNVVASDLTGTLNATIAESVGMWASPKFSPPIINGNAFERGYLAYLNARDPYNSVSGEYDLIIADRDGSNARVIFPPSGRVGLRSEDFGITPQDYVWSPDGREIAVIYQGDLWVVDVASEVVHQLTFDGGASHPVWSR